MSSYVENLKRENAILNQRQKEWQTKIDELREANELLHHQNAALKANQCTNSHACNAARGILMSPVNQMINDWIRAVEEVDPEEVDPPMLMPIRGGHLTRIK